MTFDSRWNLSENKLFNINDNIYITLQRQIASSILSLNPFLSFPAKQKTKEFNAASRNFKTDEHETPMNKIFISQFISQYQ